MTKTKKKNILGGHNYVVEEFDNGCTVHKILKKGEEKYFVTSEGLCDCKAADFGNDCKHQELANGSLQSLQTMSRRQADDLVEDYLETITLYDNRMEGVEVEELEDGRYLVALDLLSRKMRADGHGIETEIDHNDWIEIGVYGDDGGSGTPIYLERHRLASGENRIEVVVEEKPVRAGIDPRHLLIDRVPDDNLKRA